MRTIIAIMLTLACLTPAMAEQVALAADGKPVATIVTAEGAADKVNAAATDLQKYVKQMCGVELPINNDGKKVEGTGLYIGQCEVTTDADLPGEDLNPETYAIRVREGNILFTGRWPSPTCFAVYSFLEDNLGVRWFAPGDLWTWVPQGTPGDLSVEVSDIVTVPGTSPRIWSGHDWGDEWKQWNIRNKAVVSEVVPRRQFQNFLHQVITPDMYDEHPEYFPLVNGARYKPEGRYWRPCESNPEVQRIIVEYARKWFDARPTVDSFSVGMDDISNLCGCEECRAWDPEPDSYEKRQFSDRHYKFVNAIAKEIAKTHPDRYVGTLIYNIARDLPETVDKLEDNVFGFITETSALWWEDGRKEADHELTRQWAQRCKHMSRYDYFGMGTFTPRVYPHAMAEQIKFDKSIGLEGMYVEVYTFLPHTAPMIWCFAKLEWDHTLDVDELLDDFYTKMYGPAAPIMKDYFDMLEAEWNTPREGRRGWVHRNIQNQALAISPEAVDKGMEMLQQAINSTGDPDVQARVDIHRAALRYAGYAIKAKGLSQSIMDTAIVDEASASKVLEMVDEMGALAQEREGYWAECHDRDDLLGKNIRGLSDDMGYMQLGNISQLETGGFSGTTRALAWYAENGPEKLAAVVDRLKESRSGSVAKTVSGWLWVQETKPENLLANGDFEDRGANTDKAEKDWSTEGAPKGWSTWSRTQTTKFGVVGGKGRNDSAAAIIGAADSATYLQTVKAKPGEKYLCVAWLKAEPADAYAGARLGIRFRDEKGGWHPRQDLEPSVNAGGDLSKWQPVVVFATIPEGAGSLIVMPGAAGQDEGASVLFDDVALYRVEN